MTAVRAEVEEDDRVPVADRRHRRVSIHDDCRRNELVGHLLGVGRAHRLQRARGTAPDAADHRVVGLLDPVPALVAIHRVEATDDRRDPASPGLAQEALQLLQIPERAHGRRVTTIQERVHVDPGDSARPRGLQQAEQVLLRRVHAARADQAHQVQRPSILACRVHRRDQHRVVDQLVPLDGAIDAYQVLVDDPPRADVGVTDLRVSHLPLGEPDGEARAQQLGARHLPREAVEVRRAGQKDGVVLALGADAPAVEDRQEDAVLGSHGPRKVASTGGHVDRYSALRQRTPRGRPGPDGRGPDRGWMPVLEPPWCPARPSLPRRRASGHSTGSVASRSW